MIYSPVFAALRSAEPRVEPHCCAYKAILTSRCIRHEPCLWRSGQPGVTVARTPVITSAKPCRVQLQDRVGTAPVDLRSSS